MSVRPTPPHDSVDLAALVMRMSILTDLARDLPSESALLGSFIAMDLAEAVGLPEASRRVVFYASFLRYLGCTAYSPELGAAFEIDDPSLHALFAPVDLADAAAVRAAVLASRPLVSPDAVLQVIGHDLVVSQCEVARHSTRCLGLDDSIVSVLGEIYERWDGRGYPNGLAHEALSFPVRILHVGAVAALALRTAGVAAAEEILARRAGGWLDPELVAIAIPRLQTLEERCRDRSIWNDCAAAAPKEYRPTTLLDDLAELLGQFADLKSRYRTNHSNEVAHTAAAAAAWLGLDVAAQHDVRLAGLLHDVGMVAMPSRLLERPSRLTPSELEQIRLHSYFTRRVVTGIPEFERVGVIAGLHHERLDGAGYPTNANAPQLSLLARILAASDVCRALRERRPHRPAFAPAEADRMLREEVARGRLDGSAVDAVIAVSGDRSVPRIRGVALLTPRQIEVLRLLAIGMTEKQIADSLALSPRTVHNHVTAIYERSGVSSRAAVALFAVEHGLLA